MEQSFSEIFKEKKEERKNFLKKYQIPKNSRAIVVNILKDKNLQKSVTDACNSVWIFVLENLENIDFFAVDAIICEKIEKNLLEKISKDLVIPIILKDKNDKNFVEFNPMKFEWNAFLFEKYEIFSIFEKISRMLENSQYAGDKRMLLKNIFAINNPL